MLPIRTQRAAEKNVACLAIRHYHGLRGKAECYGLHVPQELNPMFVTSSLVMCTSRLLLELMRLT